MDVRKQKYIFAFLLDAMNSDNADYILDKLSRIYTIIYCNNIKDNVGIKWLKEED